MPIQQKFNQLIESKVKAGMTRDQVIRWLDSIL